MWSDRWPTRQAADLELSNGTPLAIWHRARRPCSTARQPSEAPRAPPPELAGRLQSRSGPGRRGLSGTAVCEDSTAVDSWGAVEECMLYRWDPRGVELCPAGVSRAAMCADVGICGCAPPHPPETSTVPAGAWTATASTNTRRNPIASVGGGCDLTLADRRFAANRISRTCPA